MGSRFLSFIFLLSFLPVFGTAFLYADEGYIPFFPNALEPDGIGFRGPASSAIEHCWVSNYSCENFGTGKGGSYGSIYNVGKSFNRSSPVTIEYRKEYFFKKLLYSQTFAEFGQTETNGELWYIMPDGKQDVLSTLRTDTVAITFLNNFLKPNEKALVTADYSSGRWPYFNLLTESSFIFFGKGIGIDLWFLEASWGPFLMFHDTSVNLQSCERTNSAINLNDNKALSTTISAAVFGMNQQVDSYSFFPTGCELYPNYVTYLGSQSYFGFAVGTKSEFTIVFLESDNWRVSMDTSVTEFYSYMDSNFEQVSFRGLDLYPKYSSSSTLNCAGGSYRLNDGEEQQIDCKNSKGEDHKISSDYTYGLKITYYFR